MKRSAAQRTQAGFFLPRRLNHLSRRAQTVVDDVVMMEVVFIYSFCAFYLNSCR